MEHIRIKAITEEDFDQVITSAGGSRILEEGSADYLLNEAIIELKLVSEEGFAKTERQAKLAELFRHNQPNRPVVLVNPKHLGPSQLRNYYRIVEVPIKTACKKASKQLQATAARQASLPVRVLVILNVGYTLLSAEEFKDICLRCVRNDTTGVDWIVCGGIYFFSDKFDHHVIARFEDLPINLSRSFPSCGVLADAWSSFLNRLMTEAIRNPTPTGRMPVVDLLFDLSGVRYIKPSPKMPKSNFWPGGAAPRENTSGIDGCPQVAWTFPSLSEHDWKLFKDAMPTCSRLKSTYKEWSTCCPGRDESKDPLKPLVHVQTTFEQFSSWIRIPKAHWQFADIGEFAREVFHHRSISLMEEARDRDQMLVIPVSYILLQLIEVGNDKANDLASVYCVSDTLGFERNELLIENARMFFEHGLAIAASYAIKLNVDAVLFTKRSSR